MAVTEQKTRYAATIGFFDGVHVGHRYLLQQVVEEARKRQLCPLVVTFGQHPGRVLHPESAPRLLTTRQEKLDELKRVEGGALRILELDFTPTLARLSATDFMKRLYHAGVRVLVIGYDHRFGHDRAEGFDDYRRIGAELGMEVLQARELPDVKVSSSRIRKQLEAGCMDQVALLLGRAYELNGRVVKGNRIGRKLGYRTANIGLPVEKMLPADGVYAVYVRVRGKNYVGMLDIGNRPTIGAEGAKRVEVHILDFSDNIYRCAIRVWLVARIREEQKFDSLEALAAQLHKDEAEVRQLLGKEKKNETSC